MSTRAFRASGSTGARETAVAVGPGGLPDDPAIPALGAVASRGIAAVLTGLGVRDASGDDVVLLKYHASSRCTFGATTAGGGVAVKAYASDPTPVVDVLRRLADQGIAGGTPPTVAPLVAWDPQLRLVVTRWFDAPCALDLVAAGAGARAGELAAAWLRRAAQLPATGGQRYSTEDALRYGRGRAHILTRLDADLGAAARPVADALADRPPADRPLRAIHGSLYATHVFDLGTGPGVIDWDRFRLGPLEVDAGMFEATVTRASLEPALAGQAAAARAAFRGGIKDLVDARALAWHRAVALLRLARRVAGRREGTWRRDAAALIAEAARASRAR
jgi:hypothetical protein